MIADKLANMRQGERTDLGSAELRSVSQPEAADMMGVSRSSVKRVRRVRLNGVPEVMAATGRAGGPAAAPSTGRVMQNASNVGRISESDPGPTLKCNIDVT
jgi:hypothetical protein